MVEINNEFKREVFVMVKVKLGMYIKLVKCKYIKLGVCMYIKLGVCMYNFILVKL